MPEAAVDSEARLHAMSCDTPPEFTIHFREDGAPLDCHKFIRFPSLCRPPRLKFVLSEAFVPAGASVSLELKPCSQTAKRIVIPFEHGCNELSHSLVASGTLRFRLLSDGRKYNHGHVQVPPVLNSPVAGLTSLDSLRVITLISKLMGPLSGWDGYFRTVQDTGYNMIHFTPLQERGGSNSPYSIRNQLRLADDLFEGGRLDSQARVSRLTETLERMKRDHGLFGMIDVVWNHTAHDSAWLRDHPEAGYNLDNSPHLKAAFELDELILSFSARLHECGLGDNPQSEDELQQLMSVFREQQLPSIRLWEFFVIDVNAAEADLTAAIKRMEESVEYRGNVPSRDTVPTLRAAECSDGTHGRHSHRVNVLQVLGHYADQIARYLQSSLSQKDMLLSAILAAYRAGLDELNLEKYEAYDQAVETICHNIYNRAVYERIAAHGPKLGPISKSMPLVPTYFTRIPKRDGAGMHVLANNGWIWNADPFQNFAEHPSAAYLLRDVIVWGDCVKLRYGAGPEDNPWLWRHMTEYTRQMASLFDAFRIDNCHSTPIHVAEHLLGQARTVRPELYVCAELFTGCEDKDLAFVSRLGINSLIREAMVAWDSAEITRLVLSYGGQPFGSIQSKTEYLRVEDGAAWGQVSAFSRPHNMFFDCTHDNEPPAQKRTAVDALSNAAIVAFSCCATGSAFGYDQLVPHHINIVDETRKYAIPRDMSEGILALKRMLNELHATMNEEGCCEVFARHYANDVVLVSRDNPATHSGYTLVTRTAYSPHPADPLPYETIDFVGCDIETLLFASITMCDDQRDDSALGVLGGLRCEIDCRSGAVPDGLFSSTHDSHGSKIHLNFLPPGAVIVLRRAVQRAVDPPAWALLQQPLNTAGLEQLARELTLLDLNYVLYRCDSEERDGHPERGVYDVPGYGPLAYCGLQGPQAVFEQIARHNDLAHPLCENVRQGCWLLDYTQQRLLRHDNAHIRALGDWLAPYFEGMRRMPGYLRPKYLAKVLAETHHVLTRRVLALMAPSLWDCGEFGRRLALGSVQMVGIVPSTGLLPTGPSQPSMSAGLPHFATHHLRCWGRDTFISFKGLLLLTGWLDVARDHLLAFAGCCFRGLIPNLLDAGRWPRFNARDTTWWFMQALQDYCKHAPEGHAILETLVPLRFPDDRYVDYRGDEAFARSEPLKTIVQRIMQAHAEGIHFREWNAGPALDAVMRSAGFQIDIETDWRTGFIHGGNQWNCGTWMDKMGESTRAGNRGVPSTPRDGAPVELVALLKSALDWLATLPAYGFCGVQRNDGKEVTYAAWAALIQDSFEPEFHVPEHPVDDGQFRLDARLVRRRGIYRDTIGGHDAALNYQMRPNYLMAMAIAPGLFDARRARRALALAEKHLTGPLGMRTLDPADPAYRPDYDNSNDGDDAATARGANYHQGPEWLWCMGFYLKAWLAFNLSTADSQKARRLVLTRLQPHRHLLLHSPAAGLPELTNGNGVECRDSCWTQAWSMAQFLEVVVLVHTDRLPLHANDN